MLLLPKGDFMPTALILLAVQASVVLSLCRIGANSWLVLPWDDYQTGISIAALPNLLC